jgi:ubiquinone/menaquinone biosynthesis C-methylase UbiE
MIDNKYLFLQDDFSDRKHVLFFKTFIGMINRGGHILDIGCGTGNSAIHWLGNWTGITVNVDEIRHADPDLDIKLMDVHQLGFEDETFDSFMFWDSLEHCVSPYIALSEAKRVIKEGGMGLIFMPGQNWLDHHNHIHVMTVPQMSQLLRRVGLRILNIYELKYPENHDIYCEGMAVYIVGKDKEYKPTFSGGFYEVKK